MLASTPGCCRRGQVGLTGSCLAAGVITTETGRSPGAGALTGLTAALRHGPSILTSLRSWAQASGAFLCGISQCKTDSRCLGDQGPPALSSTSSPLSTTYGDSVPLNAQPEEGGSTGLHFQSLSASNDFLKTCYLHISLHLQSFDE